MFHVWWYRSEQGETLGWLEQAQALIAAGDQLPPLLRARALLAHAAMLYGDAGRRLALGNQALALFEQLADAHGQAYVLMFVGLAYRQRGEVAQAARALQQAYEIGKQLNDSWLAGQSAIVLGTTWSFAGEHVHADRWLAEGLATAESRHDTWNIVMALFALAVAAQSRNDVAAAGLHFRAWLAFTPELGINNGSAVAHGLESIAVSAVETGEPERAARLFAAAEALWEIAGRVDFLNDRSPYETAVAAIRRQVTTPALTAAWSEGRAMSATQAVAEALRLNEH